MSEIKRFFSAAIYSEHVSEVKQRVFLSVCPVADGALQTDMPKRQCFLKFVKDKQMCVDFFPTTYSKLW